MKIYIRIKSAGRRRPVLDNVPYEIPDNVQTVRELITEIVKMEVKKYNDKGTDVQIIPFLTQEELEEQAQVGKVGFGRIYSENWLVWRPRYRSKNRMSLPLSNLFSWQDACGRNMNGKIRKEIR